MLAPFAKSKVTVPKVAVMNPAYCLVVEHSVTRGVMLQVPSLTEWLLRPVFLHGTLV